MARMVSGAYQGTADRAGVPRLAALPGDRRRRRRPIWRCTRSPRPAMFESAAYRAPRRPGLDRRMARSADQLAPQPARRARRDARGAGRRVSCCAARRARRRISRPVPMCIWLRGVGLDRTIGECGIAVVRDPAPLVDVARRDAGVRLLPPDQRKDPGRQIARAQFIDRMVSRTGRVVRCEPEHQE